jgi:tetratricopeptide (TPR) repeat protein
VRHTRLSRIPNFSRLGLGRGGKGVSAGRAAFARIRQRQALDDLLDFARGEFDAALTCIREAQLVDPLAPIVNSYMDLALAYVGRVNQAAEQILKTIELNPDFALAYYHLGTAIPSAAGLIGPWKPSRARTVSQPDR